MHLLCSEVAQFESCLMPLQRLCVLCTAPRGPCSLDVTLISSDSEEEPTLCLPGVSLRVP